MEKRIMVAESYSPFVPEESRAAALSRALRQRGVETDVVRLPRAGDGGELRQMMAARLFHLEPFCQRLIALDLLSSLLPHPAKVLWLCAAPMAPAASEVLAEYRRRAGAFALSKARRVFADPGQKEVLRDFGFPAPPWETGAGRCPGEDGPLAGPCPPAETEEPRREESAACPGCPGGAAGTMAEGAYSGGVLPLSFPAGDTQDEAWENVVRRLLE